MQYFDSLSATEIEELAEIQFTFHTAPTIAIDVSGLPAAPCDASAKVLDQGDSYSIPIEIKEFHQTISCDVNEGYVEIFNPAAVQKETTIEVNEDFGTFPSYSFVADSPNPIAPHSYAITFDYKSGSGEFLGRRSIAVYVTGTLQVAGTDVFVNPADGSTPLVSLILRDPPGDNSYSYISQDQTLSFTDRFTNDIASNVSLYTSAGTTLGSSLSGTEFGTGVTSSLNAGWSSNFGYEINHAVTLNNTISTSNSDNFIGEAADIIIGDGLIWGYGIAYDFRINEDENGECSIRKYPTYSFSVQDLTTTWFYTVGQIRDIIKGIKNDIDRVNNNELTLSERGSGEPQELLLERYETSMDNWIEVLRLHGKEKNPLYYWATREAPSFNSNSTVEESIDQIRCIGKFNSWQDQLKNWVYDEANDTLKTDIEWSNDVINAYEKIVLILKSIENELTNSATPDCVDWDFPFDSPVDLDDFNEDDFEDIIAIVGGSFEDYTDQFGNLGKSITLGGGVTFEESVNNAQNGTYSSVTTGYIGFEVDWVSTIDTKFFFGQAQNRFGKRVDFTYTRSNEEANSVAEATTIGYVISDDDPEDQHSIVVIQPVDNASTHYFDYYGGRSSCPPEEGSIFVDAPKIAIIDTATGGTTTKAERNYVAPDEAAVFEVIIENQSPIPSEPTRGVVVSMDPGSNRNGAIVTLNGVSLNNTNYQDTLEAFTPEVLGLTIERGPVYYEYPDIKLSITPECSSDPIDTIVVSAYFSSPCSPVSLIEPGPQWVYRETSDTSKMIMAITDYDPTNPNLTKAVLEYRRIGSGDDWQDVTAEQLANVNGDVTAAVLAANDTLYPANQIPKFYFEWEIPNALPDGLYELRVVMICDNFSRSVSNVVEGRLARDGVNLLSTPEPADRVWSEGDEISFTFDKDLDCPLLPQDSIKLYDVTAGRYLDPIIGCYANRIVIRMPIDSMPYYDGHVLRSSVDRVPSIPGNISDLHEWEFRVITQELFWSQADTVKLRLYRGDSMTYTAHIDNNRDYLVKDVELIAADSTFDWMEIDPGRHF